MRLFPVLVLMSALATAASLLLVVDDPTASTDDPPAAEQVTGQRDVRDLASAPDPDDPHTWQTSDQVPGEIAPALRPGQRARWSRSQRFFFRVAPGVRAIGWDLRSGRGPVRYTVLRVRWKAPGVRVNYSHGGRVSQTQPVTTMLRRIPSAIAGVNGDFFDIGDTGAPLGVGQEFGRGRWTGPAAKWTSSFSISHNNRAHIGQLPLVARVAKRPAIKITNFNSPQVHVGGTGIYTKRWGTTSGIRWTDGQDRNVRLVHVVNGRVVGVANRPRNFPSGTRIEGYYLVSRGDRATKRLTRVKKGMRVKVRAHLKGRPKVAISGNQIVLKKRRIRATDDREMHPRTAIGIDRDTKELIFLVADGRQSFSRGLTMVEVAKLMRRLGAEDALNLDGGGSSTMVARRNGDLDVLNSPSDGAQRSVPNGLEVRYKR